MKAVIHTDVISQGNPTGHTSVTVVTTNGKIQVFPLNMLHNIFPKLLTIIAFQTNPNLFVVLIHALSYFPSNLSVNV